MPVEIVPGVTADAEVAFGKPVIAGTRIPAAQVLSQLAGGMSADEIQAEYDLTPAQIQATLRYAAWLAEHEVIRAHAG